MPPCKRYTHRSHDLNITLYFLPLENPIYTLPDIRTYVAMPSTPNADRFSSMLSGNLNNP